MAATRGGRRSTPTPKSFTSTKPKFKPKPKPIPPDLLRHLITTASSVTSSSVSYLNSDSLLLLLPSQSLSLLSHLSSLFRSLSKLRSPLSAATSLHLHPPFYHRLLSSPSHPQLWAHFFRISKPSFSLLLRLLTPSLSSLLVPEEIPLSTALAATLFRLAHSADYTAVSCLFGLSPSSACRSFHSVCKAMIDKLGHLFEFKSDISRVVVGFGWISLPNCCGILGFDRFPVDGNLLGENGSLLVQALVDSEGRFLDVSAGWPSTMKPDKILKQSKFYMGCNNRKDYLDGECYDLSDGSSIPQYVLGEACFPLLQWLITPYPKPKEGSIEMEFNSVHKRGMDLVGTAFARVRERWRLVSGKWKEECIEYFPFVIVTCCLLHNFLIKCSEEFDFLEEDLECSGGGERPVFKGEEDGEGRRIRDALALHLDRVRLPE